VWFGERKKEIRSFRTWRCSIEAWIEEKVNCIDLEAQINELTCANNIKAKTKNQALQSIYSNKNFFLIEDSNIDVYSITNNNTDTHEIISTVHGAVQEQERNVYMNDEIHRRTNDAITSHQKSDKVIISTLQEQIQVLNEALQSTRSRLAIREADVDRLNADIERLIRQSHEQHQQQPISPLSMNSVTSLTELVVADTDVINTTIPNTSVHNIETTTGTVTTSTSTPQNNVTNTFLSSSSSSSSINTTRSMQQHQSTIVHVWSDLDCAMAIKQLELDRMNHTEMVRQLRQSVLSKYTKKKQQQQHLVWKLPKNEFL
jgi:hypothetical protein